MRLLVFAASALSLTGCAVAPSVTYHEIRAAYRDNWIPYQLTDTTLVVGVSGVAPATQSQTTQKPTTGSASPSPGAEPGPAAVGTPAATAGAPRSAAPGALNDPVSSAQLRPIELTPMALRCSTSVCQATPSGFVSPVAVSVALAAAPTPFNGPTLALEPAYHNLVRSLLAPAYFENSMRLKSLDVDVHDERIETIKASAAIIGGLAQLSARPRLTAGVERAPVLNLPVVLDLEEARKTALSRHDNLVADQPVVEAYRPLPINASWWYRLEFMDDLAVEGFRRSDDLGAFHASVVTSVCRPVRLVITNAPPAAHTEPGDGQLEGETRFYMGTTVADPHYVMSVPLPAKGRVEFGTLCGANVTMQGATVSTTDQVATVFFQQVQSLRSQFASSGPPPSTSPATPAGGSTAPPKH